MSPRTSVAPPIVLPVLLMAVGGLGLAVTTYIGQARRSDRAAARPSRTKTPTRAAGEQPRVAPLEARDRLPCRHLVRFAADAAAVAPGEIERLERFLAGCPVGGRDLGLVAHVRRQSRDLARRRAGAVGQTLTRLGIAADKIRIEIRIDDGAEARLIELIVPPRQDRRR